MHMSDSICTRVCNSSTNKSLLRDRICAIVVRKKLKSHSKYTVFCFFSSRRRHTILVSDWSSDVCFFFSSRRRHTRLVSDWSSDVCSSDLQLIHDVTAPIERRLALVPGVTSVESETRDGEARVTIGSAWQTDADRLRIDVTRRIEGAAAVPLDDLSVETATDLAPVIDVAVK